MTKYPERKAKSGLSPGLIVSSPRRDFNREKGVETTSGHCPGPVSPQLESRGGQTPSAVPGPAQLQGLIPMPSLDSTSPDTVLRKAARCGQKLVKDRETGASL